MLGHVAPKWPTKEVTGKIKPLSSGMYSQIYFENKDSFYILIFLFPPHLLYTNFTNRVQDPESYLDQYLEIHRSHFIKDV